MPDKHAILVGLGDYYGDDLTGYTSLPFIYKNIDDFSEFLAGKNWKVSTPLIDNTASKQNVSTLFTEKISQMRSDDWLLLYYTGHGDKIKTTTNTMDTFLVNYSSKLKYNKPKPVNDFLFDDDYDNLIKNFRLAVPNGHLITIIDCCYAFGLIDNFLSQEAFHTIIAASQANDEAYYSDNSFFFKALSESWYASDFIELKEDIEIKITQQYYLSECKIVLASQFQNLSL